MLSRSNKACAIIINANNPYVQTSSFFFNKKFLFSCMQLQIMRHFLIKMAEGAQSRQPRLACAIVNTNNPHIVAAFFLVILMRNFCFLEAKNYERFSRQNGRRCPQQRHPTPIIRALQLHFSSHDKRAQKQGRRNRLFRGGRGCNYPLKFWKGQKQNLRIQKVHPPGFLYLPTVPRRGRPACLWA